VLRPSRQRPGSRPARARPTPPRICDIARAPASVDPEVAAFAPAQLLQPLQERRHAGLPFRIVRGRRYEHANAPHPVWLLRARRDRSRSRSAEQRDELPPLHSITSSARARSDVGTSRPSALAVLRFITSSNLVGRMIGRSAGFSPLRILPV
jgi:hypothetical protein